ncbi:MAG: hypothetical protein EOP84_28435, partial [Verrucomicrobiaceae bacterium]
MNIIRAGSMGWSMGASTVEILRQQLREKFPGAHGLRPEAAGVSTSVKCFEIETFPTGGISEVIPSGPVSGVLLMVAGLLGDPVEECPHPEFVLIDGADTFDP